MSIRRAGMVASLILMLFLLTGGYYVQVSKLQNSSITFLFIVRKDKIKNPTQLKLMIFFFGN